MSFDAATTRPGRVAIANLETADSIEAQYNPEELERNLRVNYAKHVVPGLSHPVMQFVNTDSLVLTFELKFDALANPTDYDADDADNAARFLESLCYPRKGEGMRDVAPARALFLWPNHAALTTVITALKIKETRFRLDCKPTAFTANVTLEEIRDARITADEIIADGLQRADSGGAYTGRL